MWSICNNSLATLPQPLLMAVWVVANGARVGRVSSASPCMGSFVGRSATATHDTITIVVAFRQTAGKPGKLND